jgi:hypothetical protein
MSKTNVEIVKPDCFICLDSNDNVQSARICCGTAHFHELCMADFYNRIKTCSICHFEKVAQNVSISNIYLFIFVFAFAGNLLGALGALVRRLRDSRSSLRSLACI